MNTIHRLALLATSALVVACGGGGGSDGPAGTAEGFWTGTSSTGYAVRLALLEDGTVWALYSSGTTIVGVLNGTAKSGGGSLSGQGSDFFFPRTLLQSATFSGSFTPRQSVQVTTSLGSTFTGVYSPEYDLPASPSVAAGTFTGSGLTATSGYYLTTITVSSAGVVTASTPACSGTGTMVPRPSGKNIYDMRLSFTGASCPFASAGATVGVAYFDAAAKSLATLGLNAARNNGFFFIGSK
jgi:hypothetical protein